MNDLIFAGFIIISLCLGFVIGRDYIEAKTFIQKYFKKEEQI
jgi:hypothetical protein